MGHYSFFRNGSIRLSELSKDEQKAFSCGTSSNEALHRELASLMSGIWRQSEELIRSKLLIVLLGKISSSLLRLYTTGAAPHGRVLAAVSAMIRTKMLDVLQMSEKEEAERQRLRQEAGAREKIYV